MTNEAARQVEIQSFPLHKGQLHIAQNAKRFNVIRCGRRWGKTEFGIDRAIDTAWDGQPVGWFAPTYKILTESYESLKDILSPALRRKSDTEKRLELYNGGVVEFWSLENEDAGKSRKYKRVIIDECAMVRDLRPRWENAIRPTLSDLQGDAFFTSTPKGLNYFYDLHQKAEQGHPGWATFHATTYDNPFILASEIDEAKRDIPSLVFQQEYLAEFVSGVGALIDRDWLRVAEPPDKEALDITMGVDLAVSKKNMADYTAIAVMGRQGDKFYVLDVFRFRGTLQEILANVRMKASVWNPRTITVESVAAQEWAVQELARTSSLPIVSKKPDTDKVVRSQSLRAKYEHGFVYHAPYLSPEFDDELLSFPIGAHDDMVDALVYAYMPFSEANADLGLTWL
jgi:predicted phage terminase large subunit-like protein